MDSLKKNINDQLERLLAQLNDLEEVKDDDSISKEEYEELKKETLQQITEFESFLQRQSEGDLVLQVTSEAQQRIIDAKSKVFGIQDLKQVYQSHEAEKIRDQIKLLKIEASNQKITKVQYYQQVLAWIFQLEKTAKLTPDEVALKEEAKAQGASTIGARDIGEDQEKIITSHSKDQIEESRQYMQ